jgi:HSP20 family protein
VISGERISNVPESNDKDGNTRNLWRERWHGKFSRAFTLPRDADLDKISANLADGVLEVRIARDLADKEEKAPISINYARSKL